MAYKNNKFLELILFDTLKKLLVSRPISGPILVPDCPNLIQLAKYSEDLFNKDYYINLVINQEKKMTLITF